MELLKKAVSRPPGVEAIDSGGVWQHSKRVYLLIGAGMFPIPLSALRIMRAQAR